MNITGSAREKTGRKKELALPEDRLTLLCIALCSGVPVDDEKYFRLRFADEAGKYQSIRYANATHFTELSPVLTFLVART